MRKLQFQLRHLKSHYALDGIMRHRIGYDSSRPDPRMPRDAQRFWRSVEFGICDGGVVARRNGRIVGFCRYCLAYGDENTEFSQLRYLAMAGTWVAPRYRRHGLAVRMWSLLFRRLSTGTHVWVITVSRGGQQMVRKLQQLYPELEFEVETG